MIAAIASFFGMIIRFIYGLVNNNYFISILLFTVLTKIILFPLTLKQMKSAEEMKEIVPLEQKIREKYKNDKQKQAEELARLYSEHKINPIGGCLPLLIQFPIIISMFLIVKQPLTYITQTPASEITEYTKELLNKESVTEKEVQANEIIIANQKGIIDMNVKNIINLGDIPANAFSKDESKKVPIASISIPILAAIFSFIQIKISGKNANMTAEQLEMQKSMNMTMPILSGFIAYSMPLALGVYWLFGNILSIIQQIILNKLIFKKDEKLGLNKGGM